MALDTGDNWSFEIPKDFHPVMIPSELHSDYERGPFRTCSCCRGDFGTDCLYQVQKVVRGNEALFELALCEECTQSLYREFSQESLQALKAFFRACFKSSLECWRCHFCGFARQLAKTYTIAGICRNEFLIVPAIVLCDRCGEKLQAQISKKTREAQDEFIRSTFPGVPADLDLVPNLRGLLL